MFAGELRQGSGVVVDCESGQEHRSLNESAPFRSPPACRCSVSLPLRPSCTRSHGLQQLLLSFVLVGTDVGVACSSV